MRGWRLLIGDCSLTLSISKLISIGLNQQRSPLGTKKPKSKQPQIVLFTDLFAVLIY